MNKIATPDLSTVEVLDSARENITVLNPVGYPPKVTKKSAAPRPESLDGKTIYLVDCRFDDFGRAVEAGAGLVRRAHAERQDQIISLSATYQHDDPKTWEEIKANGDAAIVGVGHCSTCAPASPPTPSRSRPDTACRRWRCIPTSSTAWCSR